MKNFALTGAAGYIAPRHLRAIAETGNRLVAAFDPHDAVGVLDEFWFDVPFFVEFVRFDRHLEKLRRAGSTFHSDGACNLSSPEDCGRTAETCTRASRATPGTKLATS